MKLPAFAYHRAESLDDAVAVLAEHGAEARVLGGGQSLLPLMALRMSVPEVLVDITAAPDLLQHTVGGTVGAAVTTRTLETDPAVGHAHPLLRACLAEIGHVEIRTRGTVCGSIAHADPAAELPALLLALDGSVELAGAGGRRRVAAEEFFVGPYSTTVGDDELVAGARLPELAASAGWSVREIARRSGDFALAGVVTVLDVDVDGRCTDARIALFGVAATPRRAAGAESVLVGEMITDALLAEAATHTFDDVDVLGDIHGSAAYRRRAGMRLVGGSLAEAHRRCAHVMEVARA